MVSYKETQMLHQLRAEGSSFSNSAIKSHLEQLNYPQKSIESMLKCGNLSGECIIKNCACGVQVIPLKHNCNLRTCQRCAQIRKRRLRRRYLPLLKNYFSDKTNFFNFLTISPKNYENAKGQEHLRKSFSKFIRTKYIKERIKGGIWVLETKTKNKYGESKGWNIHLHCIIYGRYLDNKIRGKCLDCGQSYIKCQSGTMKYYCANKKCNSTNLIIKQKSKLTEIWEKSSDRQANIRITRMSSPLFTLNYMLKYITSNKADFTTIEDLAEYIVSIRKRKLINLFGEFSPKSKNKKAFILIKEKCICYKCNQEAEYLHDYTVQQILLVSSRKPPKITLDSFKANAEGIVSPKRLATETFK